MDSPEAARRVGRTCRGVLIARIGRSDSGRSRARGRSRRGAVRSGLIAALVLLAVVAGIVWAMKIRGGEGAEVSAAVAQRNARTFTLQCSACKKESEIRGAEVKNLARDEENNIQCPLCNEFAGAWPSDDSKGNVVRQ